MVARDTRVAALAVVGVAAAAALSLATGIGQDSVFTGLLITLGLGFLLPQAYLLLRPDEVPRTTRLRSVAIVSILMLWAAAGVADGWERTLVWSLAGVVFVGWVVAEFVDGYTESAPAGDRGGR